MELQGQTFTYRAFLAWSAQLTQEGKTSGPDQQEPMIEYTALNHKRMERIDKHATVDDELKAAIDVMERPQKWVVLTETWCGDSAQNVPVIGKAAEYGGDTIQLTIALRDDNLHLIDHYVPEQGRGIPRLLVFDDHDHLLAQWGARPEPAQAIIDKWKQDPANHDKEEVQKELQLWYARDKYQTIQTELVNILEMTGKVRAA